MQRLRAENRRLKMERDVLKKSDGLLCERVELRFQFIAQEKEAYPVNLLCQLMGVSRRVYYAYLKRKNRDVAILLPELFDH